MVHRLILVITMALWVHGVSIVAASEPVPPRAEIRETTLEKHGHVRIDPYYWLRERENEEVLEYLRRENEYLDAVMADTKPLEESLYEEMIGRIQQDDSSVPISDDGYLYYARTEEGRQYPIHCRRRETEDGLEDVLLDVNQLAEGHAFCSVPRLIVNRSHDLVAFPVDTVGRRVYTLMIKNLATGHLVDEPIPSVTANCVWAEDGRTLFYARQDPETLRPHQIYRHTVGTSPETDILVFEESDETFGCRILKSRSKKYLMIESSHTVSTEYRIADAESPGEEFRILEPRQRDHEYAVDHIGNHFFIRTNDSAKNFRLMKASDHLPQRKNWVEIIPHREDVLLERSLLYCDFLVVEERHKGLTRVRIIPWEGGNEYELDLGEEAYTARVLPLRDANTSVLRYAYTSLTTPASIFDFDMHTREKTLRKQHPVKGGFDPANYVSRRFAVKVRDGAEVPVTILHRKEVARNGKNPCLLFGYGSYGHTSDPVFRHDLLSLVDRGFVYAIAHVRGGQELGRSWYDDGKLLKKKNTFTDFIDCAEFLIDQQWADPERFFAKGGSAGGLLMGAVVNLRPDLFTGVIAAVPFVDIVTTMLDDSIPLTTAEYDEWGDPNDHRYYEYMLSYSPYDNVERKNYPHLLVTSGLHDSQVQYWEPTKWVAKLRALKTDDNLILLKTNMEAGHSGASGRFERYRLVALEYTFLLRLAGIKVE